MLINDYRKEFEEVRIIRYDFKTSYIECINYYPADAKNIQKIIDEIGYGVIEFVGDTIKAIKKIKN